MAYTELGDLYESSSLFISSKGKLESLGGNDRFLVSSANDAVILNQGNFDTGSGDDWVSSISEKGNPGTFSGIFNNGRLTTAEGNDTLIGKVAAGGNAGIYNQKQTSSHIGIINLGDGDDTIIGESGNTGILNEGGIISLGNGINRMRGRGQTSSGIYVMNYGSITAGDDADEITGEGHSGISCFGSIRTGSSNDKVTGTGTSTEKYYGGIVLTGDIDNKGNCISNGNILDTGDGDDEVTGQGGTGIINRSLLYTGTGSDTIRGTGVATGIENGVTINTGDGDDYIVGEGKIGIINNGEINTGDGNDIVSALAGGFAIEDNDWYAPGSDNQWRGSINLGAGDDQLIGFGSGRFFGEQGEDTLRLGEGLYMASGNQLKKGFTTMNLYGFEKVGGTSGASVNLASGGYYINAQGILDTNLTNAVAINPSANEINEGSGVTFQILAPAANAGTSVYFTITGTGIDYTDFTRPNNSFGLVAPIITGGGQILQDGSLSLTFNLENDSKSEGPEYFDLTLYLDSSRSIQIGSSVRVSINDTSRAAQQSQQSNAIETPAQRLNPQSPDPTTQQSDTGASQASAAAVNLNKKKSKVKPVKVKKTKSKNNKKK